MPNVLLVADSRSTIDRMHASLSGGGITLIDHDDPDTAAATAYELGVDRVLTDMQVGSMGAMAVTRAVRGLAGTGTPIPVTVLLDREADAFLARRAGADSWVLKTAQSRQLRDAMGVNEATS
jgi:DNA-binding response OmpR family regulator